MPYRDRTGKIKLTKREMKKLKESNNNGMAGNIEIEDKFKDLEPLDMKDEDIIMLKNPEKRLLKEDKKEYEHFKGLVDEINMQKLFDFKVKTGVKFNIEGEPIIELEKVTENKSDKSKKSKKPEI